MSKSRLPEDANGLQLNFCKTLACSNFGVSKVDGYVLQHVNPKRPTMVCRECGAFPPLINNLNVVEELARQRKSHTSGIASCGNLQCKNAGLPVQNNKSAYQAFGRSGDKQRYRCKACQSTFVDKQSTLAPNSKVELQTELIALLFLGYSVKEICDKLSLKPKSFYDHINHIALKCRQKMFHYDQLWLSRTDEYHLASAHTPLQPVSHNGVLWIATGDAKTGYMLNQTVNYSLTMPDNTVEHYDAYAEETRFVPKSFCCDVAPFSPKSHSSLKEQVEWQYQQILARENVEDPMGNLTQFTYPSKGGVIRPQYSAYGHYLLIAEQTTNNKPISLYLPQEPLLRSSALSVFKQRIYNKEINIVYVAQDPNWSRQHNVNKIDIIHLSWWRDRWAIANQDNGQKGICHLAGENNDYNYWLKNATITPIQTYQDKFQRLFSLFINEPRRNLRPNSILPLLDIYRAWYNLCNQDPQGLTKAQYCHIEVKALTLNNLLT